WCLEPARKHGAVERVEELVGRVGRTTGLERALIRAPEHCGIVRDVHVDGERDRDLAAAGNQGDVPGPPAISIGVKQTVTVDRADRGVARGPGAGDRTATRRGG